MRDTINHSFAYRGVGYENQNYLNESVKVSNKIIALNLNKCDKGFVERLSLVYFYYFNRLHSSTDRTSDF